MDITHDNVCSSMLSCFYSHLLSTGRPISSLLPQVFHLCKFLSYLQLNVVKNYRLATYLTEYHNNYIFLTFVSCTSKNKTLVSPNL